MMEVKSGNSSYVLAYIPKKKEKKETHTEAVICRFTDVVSNKLY